MTADRFAIACHTSWFWDSWRNAQLPGEWLAIRAPEELQLERLEAFDPRLILFPHWSWAVPESIWRRFECVCFHSTPVPYGRGGSPIQNMVLRGHQETEVVALRMQGNLDAGPVYLRRPLSLQGGGDEIYIRLGALVLDMIEELAATPPEPIPQEGEAVVFRRRKPEESRLPQNGDLTAWHDQIRVLDAEGYPPAFVDFGGMRLSFSRSALRRGYVEATVTIRHLDGAGREPGAGCE